MRLRCSAEDVRRNSRSQSRGTEPTFHVPISRVGAATIAAEAPGAQRQAESTMGSSEAACGHASTCEHDRAVRDGRDLCAGVGHLAMQMLTPASLRSARSRRPIRRMGTAALPSLPRARMGLSMRAHLIRLGPPISRLPSQIPQERRSGLARS